MNNPRVIEEKEHNQKKRIEELGLTNEAIERNKLLITVVDSAKAQELGNKLVKIIGSKNYDENNETKFNEVMKLIKDGADINYENDKGNFPLILCARKGYTKTFITLLKFGADIKKTNKNKTSVIMSSARNGYLTILEIAILLGCDINLLCFDADTALIMAKRHGNESCFNTLVENNAILNIKNFDNLTSYEIKNADNPNIDDAKYYAKVPESPYSGTIHQDAVDLIEEAKRQLMQIKETSALLTPIINEPVESVTNSPLSFTNVDLPEELTQENINTNFKVR